MTKRADFVGTRDLILQTLRRAPSKRLRLTDMNAVLRYRADGWKELRWLINRKRVIKRIVSKPGQPGVKPVYFELP